MCAYLIYQLKRNLMKYTITTIKYVEIFSYITRYISESLILNKIGTVGEGLAWRENGSD